MKSKSFPPLPDFQAINDFWQQNSQYIPGFSHLTMPGMSLEELDKRIAEFKAVEAWLKLNADLLRNGIHAMEMQRATLAALNQFAPPPSTPPQSNSTQTEQATATNSKQTTQAQPEDLASAWWNVLQQQFEQITKVAAQSFTPPHSGTNASTPTSTEANQTGADENANNTEKTKDRQPTKRAAAESSNANKHQPASKNK